MANDEDPGLQDLAEIEPWYCVRCECDRRILRRLNASGITLFGALTALGLPLWAQAFPPLVTQVGAPWAYAISAVYVVLVAGEIVSTLRHAGAARNIVCGSCEGSDVLPRDSPRASRLRLASALEAASLHASLLVDHDNERG
jgi:hypothetical protein